MIIHLLDRVTKAERAVLRTAEDLVSIVNRMNAAVIGPNTNANSDNKAQDVYDALNVVERIGHRIATETPSLRRVLEFSIGVRLAHFQEKTGITVEDLKGLEGLAPQAFWPASSMVVEEWGNHRVIYDGHGHRKALYRGVQGHFDPIVIWAHALPKRQGEWEQAYLEIVLHENFIKFWAVDGRFDRKIPPEREARAENVFAAIPLRDGDLVLYRSPSKKETGEEQNEEPEPRAYRPPWIHDYAKGDIFNEQLAWYLTVIDFVSYLSE